MRAAGAVALSMLLLDAALIYAHVRGSGLGAGPFDLSWLVSGPWRLDAERGRGELFQYLKYLVMTALALRLRERRSWRAAGVLALFSLLLLLDDAFQLHERLGEAVTGPRGSPSALTAGFAELLGFAVLGGVFVWFLVGSWRRGAKERRVAGPVAMLVAGLAFLGAVVDLVSGPLVLHATATFLQAAAPTLLEPLAGLLAHAADPRGALGHLPQLAAVAGGLRVGVGDPLVVSSLSELRLVQVLLTVVEDGGELVVTSLLVAYLAGVAAAAPKELAQGTGSAVARRRGSSDGRGYPDS